MIERILSKHALLVALCAAVLLLAVATSYTARAPTPLEREAAERAAWEARIKAVGGLQAYAELAEALAAAGPGEQHVSAHLFGAALYQVEGTAGVGVCDTRFSYGCFHELLGSAIATEGLSVVEPLARACAVRGGDAVSVCEHGIGHGIQSHLGYAFDHLEKALDACAALPHQGALDGCYSGALMEYNLRVMLREAGTIRPLVGQAYGAPCDSLDPPYKPACVFWQPQWWHNAVGRGDTSDAFFERLGNMCRAWELSPRLADVCMGGVGIAAAPSGFAAPARAAQLCEAAGSSPREEALCKGFAAHVLRVELGSAAAAELCASLTGEGAQFCNTYASGKATLAELPSWMRSE